MMKASELAKVKFDNGYSSSQVWNIICTTNFETERDEEIFAQEFRGLHAHSLM